MKSECDTILDLGRLRAIAEAATPGPRTVDLPDFEELWSEYHDSDESERRDDFGIAWISCDKWSKFAGVFVACEGEEDKAGVANAKLIAVLDRETCLALLDTIDRLTAERDRLTTENIRLREENRMYDHTLVDWANQPEGKRLGELAVENARLVRERDAAIAETAKLREESHGSEFAGEILNEVQRMLKKLGCGCDPTAHDATPPMWYAEWIACAVMSREKRIKAMEAERDEQSASFELRWKADMRAIKAWQAANPGNELVWPDHADLCVWLLAERDAARQALAAARAEVWEETARAAYQRGTEHIVEYCRERAAAERSKVQK